MEQDNKRIEDTTLNSPSAIEDRAVTFKRLADDEEKHASAKTGISKEDQETLDYFQSLRQAFTETELLQVLDIISALSADKENIAAVLDLLEGDAREEERDASPTAAKNNLKMEGSY